MMMSGEQKVSELRSKMSERTVSARSVRCEV